MRFEQKHCDCSKGNQGNGNTGRFNTGQYNSGEYNSGVGNSGSFNSGDYNACSYSSGCFNTKETPIMMFDKPSNITFSEWKNSEAYQLLRDLLVKTLQHGDSLQDEWDNLSDKKKEIIKSIPNFDAEIFKKCTGIDTI